MYLHYTTVYCTCLSVLLVAFRSGWGLAGWLPCWERACHSALRVCCRRNVLLCFMYFLSHLVGTLNLIASIPGLTCTSPCRKFLSGHFQDILVHLTRNVAKFVIAAEHGTMLRKQVQYQLILLGIKIFGSWSFSSGTLPDFPPF